MTKRKAYLRAVRTAERLESALNGFPPDDIRRFKVSRLIRASWSRINEAERGLPNG